MYIIDTNVVSEFRKIHAGKADPNVAKWSDSTSVEAMFLSVITIFELQVGVLRMERKDAAQARLFRDWYENYVIKAFSGRVLPMGLEISRRCAGMHVPDPAPFRDSTIAATALVHGMTVVTRNTADFARTGAQVLNPWQPY